jgi:nucleoside-diphosphate-sugar epimerase
MKILMIGGTGFLGYFSCRDMVERGHEVVAVGRPPAPGAGMMPGSVSIVLEDIDALSDDGFTELVSGCDAVVYGGGADGRHSFPPPVINGYRAANVDPVRRMIPLLKKADVARFVILGSYYTALDRTFPDFRIAERHPYIQSRVEQAAVAFETGGDGLSVAILELPYIFGAAPGRGTLWGNYVKQVQQQEIITVPDGGTACVTAQQVGWAVTAACERLSGHRHFAIVEENMTYERMLRHFADALGLPRSFERIPPETMRARALEEAEQMASAPRAGGYDPVGMAEMQAMLLYLDPLPAREALGYGHDDVGRAIGESAIAMLEHD